MIMVAGAMLRKAHAWVPAGVIGGGNQRVGLLPRILTAVFAWLETGARRQPRAGGAPAQGFEVTAVVDGIRRVIL